MNIAPLKIAYVTTYDAHDPSKWSGLGYYIARSLEMAGCQLEYIGPLKEHFSAYFKAKTVVYRKFRQQAFQRDREPAILDGYARQVEKRLKNSDAQIIFSPGSVAIAHLETKLPIVFWSDATYAAVQEAYRWELPAVPISIERGHAMDQRTVDKASLCIYASDWAAQSAIERYHAEPGKVKVVPFGANIEESRTIEQVRGMISARSRDVCKLLFVGVGWERKGGDIAIDVARQMNEMGVKTELTIVGSIPPNTSSLPSFIKPLGFLNKSTPQGKAHFESLFAESHFLILPARAEAFGLVLCEANAFGLPALASNVGGIPTIVREGVNGRLFAPEGACAFAQGTAELFQDFNRYSKIAESSFREYQARLNWGVAGMNVRALLEGLVSFHR
jgi:glycosyltransferase involved in cell wall biosynthesis